MPVNSIRFISGETEGMKRLRTSPEKNAPNIPSRPISDDRAAERKRRLMTKMNCMTASEYLWRNQRVRRRMRNAITRQ